jgi:hypothetical protein
MNGGAVTSNFAPGVLQLKRRLFRGVERINSRIHSAEHRDRVKSNRVFRTVGAEDTEDVTFLESFLRQAGGDPANRVFKLCISKRATSGAINQRNLVLICDAELKMKSVTETSGIVTSGYGPRKIILVN